MWLQVIMMARPDEQVQYYKEISNAQHLIQHGYLWYAMIAESIFDFKILVTYHV